jgi:CDP-diacylglycerol---glycerol-3-phosphate 3-phosphatidyltransferase
VVPPNVPNVLTMLRILLVPVLLVALLDKSPSGDLLAAIVFAVASFTDAIDGYLARTRNAVTNFGKLMDPLADKLLIVAALVALVSLGRLEAWVAMVIIARELAVTLLRMGATQQGVVAAANPLGKLKTVVQIATIIALIASSTRPTWLDLMVYGMVLVTVVSGVDFVFGLRRRLSEAEAARATRKSAAESGA